jgi:hypothetical protein
MQYLGFDPKTFIPSHRAKPITIKILITIIYFFRNLYILYNLEAYIRDLEAQMFGGLKP